VGGAELQVFVRDGCPHCAAAKAFLPELQKLRPGIQVRLRPLESDPAAIDDLLRYSRQAGIGAPGVPTFVLEGQVLVGFDDADGRGRELLDLMDTLVLSWPRVPTNFSVANLDLITPWKTRPCCLVI
jgi:glutaredoxin